MGDLPGGPISKRPLQFFWLCDCSGSMSGEKIQQLNFCVKNAIPLMQKTAKENPYAQLLVRVLSFSSGSRWIVVKPTPVESFTWQDLTAIGQTDMGKALTDLANQLKMPPMDARGYPPVIVLVSDGQPTDDFATGLRAVMDQPWGKRAIRMAIAIGRDADTDVLQKFVGNSEIPVLQANNPDSLMQYIKWVSTEPIKAASAPPSQPRPGGGGPVPGPIPPPPGGGGTQGPDVW